MRYLDTGSRDPNAAVGNWLKAVLSGGDVIALRLQSGYFGPEPLGYLEPVLRDLAGADGQTSILVGSNGGQTARETVEDLLRLAGPARVNLRIGIASFSDGLFHPKVYHVMRSDGSMAAYVGSANFTHPGLSGKNIEAGITLDTNDGDSPGVLIEILDSIDQWFNTDRTGFFPVSNPSDLSLLVADGILGAPRPARVAARPTPSGRVGRALTALSGLVRLPAISTHMAAPPPASSSTNTSAPVGAPVAPPFVDSWSKTLPVSDAQRKPDGNQSGVVALTQANRRGQIDQTTYFRSDLFGGLIWQQTPTRTGHMMDVTHVTMHTTVLGNYLGQLDFEVTHDNGRESAQHNYTAKLSLRPIRADFDRVDMTGRTLEIGRDAAGVYWLEIR